MTCSFCSAEFSSAESRLSCDGCSLAGGGGCRSVRCPRCGYDMPDEPQLFARIRAWLGRRPAATAGPTTLASMRPGQRGTIVTLDVGDAAQARKLMALGVIPGAAVELERNRPAVVLRTGYTQLAIDEALAAAVVVRIGG